MTSHSALDLAVNRVRIRDLACDLDLARDAALTLSRVRVRARDLERDPGRARDLALTLSRVRVLDLAVTLARARDLANHLANDHVRDLARDLAAAHAHVRRLADDLNLNLTPARASDRARDLANHLVRDLARASGRVHALVNGLEPATVTVPSSPAVAGPRGARPGWMSRHLVQRAVWCLPSAHRARYREEFDAELAEIAETRGRVRQWGYAVRLVGRAVALRHAVQAAVPQREQS